MNENSEEGKYYSDESVKSFIIGVSAFIQEIAFRVHEMFAVYLVRGIILWCKSTPEADKFNLNEWEIF